MDTALTKREEAYIVHSRIMTNGRTVQTAFVEICKDLKQMHDDKLFAELGYDSFENYAEQACGLKQRQAYSYIAAYERLGEDYLRDNSQLGITKLELISQISSYEREEFLENVNPEELSTRELQEQVKEFKGRIEQLTLDLEEKEQKYQDEFNDNADLQADLHRAHDRIRELEERQKGNEVVIEAADPNSDVFKAEVEKAVKAEANKTAELVKKLKAQVKDQKAELKAKDDEKASAVKEAKEKAFEQANKTIDELTAKNKQVDEQLQQAIKQAKVANADEDVIALRLQFNVLQSTANEVVALIAKIKEKDAQQAEKLASAVKSILEKQIQNLEAVA